MAVLQMKRISLCAMKENRKAILERLQELGAVEIDIPLEDDDIYETADVSDAKAAFEREAQTADRALEVLQEFAPEKTGIFAALEGKPLVNPELFEKAAANRESYSGTAKQIVSLERQRAEKKAGIQKLQSQAEALEPWQELCVPVNGSGTRRTAVLIGTIAGALSLEDVYTLIARGAPEVDAADAHVISADKDYTYLAVICLDRDVAEVEHALRAGEFAKPPQAADRIPSEYRAELLAEIEKDERELTALEHQIMDYAGSREDLQLISDYYRARAGKYQVLGQLPQTASAFALSGYVPAQVAEGIAQELSERYEAAVDVEEIPDEEEAPVLLKNNRFSRSVEGIVASFGLPKKGEIDPTAVTSIFYVFLFGLMLSDAAYGLIIALACGVMLSRFPGMSDGMERSIRLFFWCGISTLVWGVLFGGYFGDLVEVASATFFGRTVSIPALWFVPLKDPMKLLLYSLLFGVIHLFAGLALRGYTCLRDGRYLDFVCDCVLWYVFLLGLLGLLLPSELFAGIAGRQIAFPAAVNTGAKWFTILGAAGILLMEGRSGKNPAVRLALGAYGLYGTTSWLSDVLSYSRLLALGLATGVIAQVVNQMGSMAGGGIFGAVLFLVVFVIGHTFNLAINFLGAYVHTNRLQYVEFFGKFYEGGGRAFEPFRLKTKYMDVKEENDLC